MKRPAITNKSSAKPSKNTSQRDLIWLVDSMVADGRTEWNQQSIYKLASRIGISRNTVDALGPVAIRDAYIKAWRSAVDLDLT